MTIELLVSVLCGVFGGLISVILGKLFKKRKLRVKVNKLHDEAIVPKQAYTGDVGCDLATIDEGVVPPKSWKIFRTGLAFEPPKGYELQIRSRSGLAAKNGVFILNSPATIEPTYRGDVGIIVANFSDEPFVVNRFMRLGQAVFKPYEECIEFENFSELSNTERGEKKFGSSGV
jgi:dUTP pyrophosphatase